MNKVIGVWKISEAKTGIELTYKHLSNKITMKTFLNKVFLKSSLHSIFLLGEKKYLLVIKNQLYLEPRDCLFFKVSTREHTPDGHCF